MGENLEKAVGQKVLLRLVAPCALYILVGAIDRTNVSFAALQMNAALGMSGTEFGFAAGILFVGYVLAKYPSVRLFETFGMRRWLGAITLVWGIAACAMSAVTQAWELFALRVIVGLAEGGLSSGLMIYLSNWAPERYRASILAIPIMSISISQIVGAPLSGWLLEWDNFLAMEGWRFMFLAEGLPAVALAVFAWLYFPDKPDDARWLPAAQRHWLAANVRGARAPSAALGNPEGRWEALKSPIGWVCGLIWFCILASNYGIMFWLPQIVQGMSELTPSQVGWIVALPGTGSAIGLLLNAHHSDRTQERYLHVGVPALVGGAGLLAAYFLGAGLPGLVALVIGGACTGCTVAAFWAIPTKLLSPAALAMGIVMINVLGSFAGATVPAMMGALTEASGSFLPATLLVVAFAVACAALSLLARSLDRRHASTDQQL